MELGKGDVMDGTRGPDDLSGNRCLLHPERTYPTYSCASVHLST